VALVKGSPVVVVGSYDHNVYALDARTGDKLWRFTTGGGVYSTPAIWHAPARGGKERSDTARGGKERSDTARRSGATQDTARRSGATQDTARVLVFAAASDRAIYALDAESGRRVWVHTLEAWRPTMGGARLSAPAVGRAGGRWAVFVGHWVWDKSRRAASPRSTPSRASGSGTPRWVTTRSRRRCSIG
jgi:outer membrane protein assembly factor BamB